MIGNTLSHYKIIEKLGQGGMGEVYLAEDSRLDRKVALKILPQHLSERAELRERFEREARAVSLFKPSVYKGFVVFHVL
jgi:serine/threonine protein kinase